MKRFVKVNGADVLLEETEMLQEFLVAQGYRPEAVAVERNGEIVSKSAYENCRLADGDVLEVVRFVGGG